MSAELDAMRSLAVARLRRALRRWRAPAVLWPRDGALALPLAMIVGQAWDAGLAWRIVVRAVPAGTPTPEFARSQLGGMWRIERIELGDGDDLSARCTAARIDGVIAAEAPPVPVAVEWSEPLAGWDAASLHALTTNDVPDRASADATLTGAVVDRLKLLGYL